MLILLRHGPSKLQEGASEKTLTDDGRVLVARRRDMLAQTGADILEILHSPMQRTFDTGVIIAPDATPKEVPGLWLPNGPDYDVIFGMYKRIGEAPARAYYDAATEEERAALDRFTQNGAKVLKAHLHAMHDVLVAGHAVLLNLIGYELSKDERLLDQELAECEGFTVKVGGDVEFLPSVQEINAAKQ